MPFSFEPPDEGLSEVASHGLEPVMNRLDELDADMQHIVILVGTDDGLGMALSFGEGYEPEDEREMVALVISTLLMHTQMFGNEAGVPMEFMPMPMHRPKGQG